MSRIVVVLALLIVAAFGAGCVSPRSPAFPPAAGAPRKTIHVVSHGWHTGVVFSRADIPPNVWPAQNDFAPFEFIEVGWGDDGFYRTEKITAGITLKAIFWPTPSVLHMVGFDRPPAKSFPDSKVIRVELTPEGFSNLCAFVDAAYTRTASSQAIPLGPGLYGESEFYRANGSYYFPRSCNYWTASALRSAGCPTVPLCSVTASCLMAQVRRFGVLVQPDRGSAPPREIIP